MRRFVLLSVLLGSVALPASADTAAGERALEEGRYAVAAEEFREAARRGDPAAQYRLGRLHAEGLGVPQDYVEAHKWLNLAAAGGFEDAAAERDRLTRLMTPEQLAASQSAAASFPADARAGAAPAAPGYSVAALQRALNEAGYAAGVPDGIPGAQTRDAIRAFQRSQGLPVTGEPSPELFAQLTGADGQPPESAVTTIQAELRQRGYEVPSVTGRIDEPTRAAIRAYQADAGLPVTGEATPELLARLSGDEAGTLGDAERRSVVARVQQALNALGYDAGRPDGTLGPRTRDAIRTYEADAGLRVTGEPSPRLLDRLAQDVAEARGLPAAETQLSDAQLVQEVERRLQARGYEVGPVDGRLDARTVAAIRRFEADQGLGVSGEIDAELLSSLDATAAPAQAAPPSPEQIFGQIIGGIAAQALGAGDAEGEAEAQSE